ncbi:MULTISPECIES: LysE family translocator [Tatumella]|uniref:Alcohol dehydrogenase n=1 Tax=Tatumella morbirosei TaxID=642227 RepID=A0A095VXR6_9GAMM|nr:MULTISPECIES: LysE family translocator [Tatumella]KGD79550.1 alcohol dehydrogenase [Tatumella morbirosei]
MEMGLFLSLLGFLWVAAITPGPNNMLLTASGANFGFIRSFPLMLGIMLGMQVMLLMVAFGIGGLILVYPALHLLLKVAGSLYLLWLSWKIGSAPYEALDIDNSAVSAKAMPFWQGGLLQLINPKAWLMSLGAVASFSLAGVNYRSSVLAISFAMFLVNIVAGVIWLGFGTFISRWLKSRQSWTIFNIGMGLLTASCVILIWL